jgi:spermidine synthase
MKEPKRQAQSVAGGERLLPLVGLLFVGSGCAALIYEVVWFQLLQLIIGSSAVSLGVVLGTFMGGMCLGSLLLPRVIGTGPRPLRVYAALELGIGLVGLAVIFLLPYLDRLYSQIAMSGGAGLIVRGAVAGICLLPPTLLMGATLPAIARWVEATPRGVSWLGFFYGANIAGAVAGCLLAGFYLLRVYDMPTATYVAVAINVVVAAAATVLSRIRPAAGVVRAIDATAAGRHRAWGVYAAIAISGLCALGAEVIWTRLLSLTIGGTVYAFSIILAVFLTGLGIGSGAGAWLARNGSARFALGVCQLLLAAAIAWTAQQLAAIPYWPIDLSLARSPWHVFQLDLLRCLWAVLPPAILWGASFPLALAAAAGRAEDAGRLVGQVYAANTVGAIVGALGFSIGIITWLGTQQAQQLLIALSAMAALLALGPLVLSMIRQALIVRRRWAAAGAGSAAMLAGVAAAFWMGWTVPQTPGDLIAHGRYLPTQAGGNEILFQGEGMNASVAVSLHSGTVRSFHVSGKVEASSLPQDMRLQRMLGHIPALVHPRPRSVLIVGCGAGVTAGSFVVHPDIKRIVICEIEPLIPQVVAKYFKDENYDVVNDERVEIVYDDARHFIRTTSEKFDIITSDPIHPWVKGAATLYTKEYFELCKQRLNPGGVITQWVPLYESTREAVKSELATFFDVFPGGTIWSNDDEGKGYDVVLLAQQEPTTIEVERLAERLNRDDHRRVADSLVEVGFHSPVDLLATYAGTAADLRRWLADAEINRDRNLRLQYLAGMGANYYSEGTIYGEMKSYRKYPEKLFVASSEVVSELRRRLDPAAMDTPDR